MSTTWERYSGREDRFAIRLALRPDPDPGSADPDFGESWGSFQIWVQGKNLCAHIDQGEQLESVHWYLLPLLEWITDNWDPLFHEERLPLKQRGTNASESLQRTQAPPLDLADRDVDAWDLDWFQWWQRHSLRASRAGGLFPDLVVRRWRDKVEFSWGESPLAGAEGLSFLAPVGAARLDPADVGPPALEVVTAAIEELVRRRGASSHLTWLRDRAAGIETVERRAGRLAWMAGLRNVGDSLRTSWRRVEQAFEGAAEGARTAALGVQEEGGVIRGSCQAALLFGAVAPDVSVADVERLAQLLIEQYAPGSEAGELRQLVEPSEPSAFSPPWEDGYEKAEDVREELGLAPGEPVDPHALFERLGIDCRTIVLDDVKIRGIAVASPDHRPTVVVNKSSIFGETDEAERFTLVHELCHLIYDRDRAQRLAVASGPWAPLDVEKRANAFAAYFLMPSSGIRDFIADMDVPVDSLEGVQRIAEHFGVSVTAMIEHLHNLDVLDDDERAHLRGWAPGTI